MPNDNRRKSQAPLLTEVRTMLADRVLTSVELEKACTKLASESGVRLIASQVYTLQPGDVSSRCTLLYVIPACPTEVKL